MQKDINTSKILEKAFEFEKLCARIFETNGITVERNVFVDKIKMIGEIDLILTNQNGKRIAVEIKYYRTRKPSKGMLEQAINRIKVVARKTNIENQMLIIGIPIDSKLKTELSNYYNIKIVDSR